jgi:hypothetical protein
LAQQYSSLKENKTAKPKNQKRKMQVTSPLERKVKFKSLIGMGYGLNKNVLEGQACAETLTKYI